ncbi:hypothetical protein V8E36_004590, partial [Tilletia maclaganii]
IWDFITQMARALNYLHGQTIIHRDLMTANVLIRKSGNFVVADFGLSRLLQDGQLALTRCGPPGYAAPEQLTGERGYSGIVDVWAVGVITIEMAHGNRP